MTLTKLKNKLSTGEILQTWRSGWCTRPIPLLYGVQIQVNRFGCLIFAHITKLLHNTALIQNCKMLT